MADFHIGDGGIPVTDGGHLRQDVCGDRGQHIYADIRISANSQARPRGGLPAGQIVEAAAQTVDKRVHVGAVVEGDRGLLVGESDLGDLRLLGDRSAGGASDEDEEGAVTTVTFEDQGGKTLLTFHEVYPSEEALEEALQGSAAGLPEQLEQLDELLSGLGG